jgi:hypothetical protein
MKIFHAFIALLFIAATTHAQSKNGNVDFNQIVNKIGMTFSTPKGSVKAAVVKNKQIAYQYAVKYPDHNLEIRYLVMPSAGKATKAPVASPGNKSASQINDPFDMFCMDLATKAGGGIKDPQIQVAGFDPAQGKKEFGADKITFWMIPVKNNSFGTEYKFCNMVAMHKENGANAFVFYLANSLQDITKAFGEIGPRNVYYNLKYKP